MGEQRLVMELELHVEPISGRIQDEGAGVARSFTGWLGLIGAIEALKVAAHTGLGEPDRTGERRAE